jgi:CubicO group peptidase (beta-lactamase class C family)
MSRRLCLALVAAIALAVPASARADGSIQRYLDKTMPAGTSGTVAAARDGKLVHCQGIGKGGSCDTVYDVMSLTKQFTAAAILKLETMGKLRVTDPIGRFVGPVPDDKRGITLQQLLTHTSGLPDALGDDYDVLSRQQMLDGVLKSELVASPGQEYRYSNVGYSLLAAIVERASGMGYEQFLAKRLFKPAGMTQTGYVLPTWKRDRVAVEYDEHGRTMGRPFDHPWADDGPYWNLRGNGGLLSTARDMFRWHRALEGDNVLSRRAKRKLFKPRVPIPLEGYEGFRAGYGWAVTRIDGGRVAAHSGGNGWSYGVAARFLDDGVLVFWISNRASRVGKWNLEPMAQTLTVAIGERVRDSR